MISKALLAVIKKNFKLDWHGIHGVSHWSRVRLNGKKLCALTNADFEVVELFAFLHDSQRYGEDYDPQHGHRAAKSIDALLDQYLFINNKQKEQLKFACRYHSEAELSDDITVQVCWDSDRLDLGRVGIMPKSQYLLTKQAKDRAFIEAAYKRSTTLSS